MLFGILPVTPTGIPPELSARICLYNFLDIRAVISQELIQELFQKILLELLQKFLLVVFFRNISKYFSRNYTWDSSSLCLWEFFQKFLLWLLKGECVICHDDFCIVLSILEFLPESLKVFLKQVLQKSLLE